MRAYWNNILDTATAITADTTKDGTSVNNITQKHLSKRFSFDANNGKININLGSSTNIKKILIGGCNATSSATMVLNGNTIADMTTPVFSTTIDLYDSTWAENLDETYQYWQISASDSSLTYLWFGYIYMGLYLQLPGIVPSYVLNYNTTSSTSISVSLQPYGDRGVQNFSSGFEFPIITDYVRTNPDGIDMATKTDILEMWQAIEGVTPFYLEIAESSLDVIPPFFGLINQGSLAFKLDNTQGFYSMGFKFQETK